MPSYREDAHRDKIKEQTIKLDSIDSIKLINNSVLVRVDDLHDTITHGTLTLHLDTSFEQGIHAANKGVVVGVPDKYIYSEKPLPNTAEWDTDIEVEEGDQVWFDYLTGIECSKIECEDKLYYILPYHALYVSKRGKEVIPLNGYVLLDPRINKEKFIEFEIEREDAKYAMVAYSGSCNKKYRPVQTKMGEVFYYDDPVIEAGKTVIYGKVSGLFLEQEEHSSFNGDERYRIIQRRFLTGVLESEKAV